MTVPLSPLTLPPRCGGAFPLPQGEGGKRTRRNPPLPPGEGRGEGQNAGYLATHSIQ